MPNLTSRPSIGALVPLLGYWFNKVMPWKTEQVKGIIQVILTAIGGVFYTLVFADGADMSIGDFLQQCYTAIIAGLFAHKTLWAPAGINLKFGAAKPGEEIKVPA